MWHLNLFRITNELEHEKMYHLTCVPDKDSYQCAHLHSLIRVLIRCAADLNFRLARISKGVQMRLWHKRTMSNKTVSSGSIETEGPYVHAVSLLFSIDITKTCLYNFDLIKLNPTFI